MTEDIKLSRLETVLEAPTYPARREDLAADYAGTTVLYADGEEDLGALIERTTQASFEDAEDCFLAIQNALPIEAVGEPGQSEGDA